MKRTPFMPFSPSIVTTGGSASALPSGPMDLIPGYIQRSDRTVFSYPAPTVRIGDFPWNELVRRQHLFFLRHLERYEVFIKPTMDGPSRLKAGFNEVMGVEGPLVRREGIILRSCLRPTRKAGGLADIYMGSKSLGQTIRSVLWTSPKNLDSLATNWETIEEAWYQLRGPEIAAFLYSNAIFMRTIRKSYDGRDAPDRDAPDWLTDAESAEKTYLNPLEDLVGLVDYIQEQPEVNFMECAKIMLDAMLKHQFAQNIEPPISRYMYEECITKQRCPEYEAEKQLAEMRFTGTTPKGWNPAALASLKSVVFAPFVWSQDRYPETKPPTRPQKVWRNLPWVSALGNAGIQQGWYGSGYTVGLKTLLTVVLAYQLAKERQEASKAPDAPPLTRKGDVPDEAMTELMFGGKDPFALSGVMEIETPPLTRIARNRVKAGIALHCREQGVITKHVHRFCTDGAIFDAPRTMRPGGTVLIDMSGSMCLDTDQLSDLAQSCPNITVAGYCGDSRGHGLLTILAKGGRTCAEEDFHKANSFGGANEIDVHALNWMVTTQRRPFVWVCDGGVTGRNDRSYAEITEWCLYTVQEYGVFVIRRIKDALEIVSGGIDVCSSHIGGVLAFRGDEADHLRLIKELRNDSRR